MKDEREEGAGERESGRAGERKTLDSDYYITHRILSKPSLL
jgi:hypothetical protein